MQQAKDIQLEIIPDLQLMPGVNRGLVHHSVVFQSEVLQLAVVPECPPLCVHTHPSLLPFHQLHSPHLLHVTHVTAGSWQ